MDILAIDGRCVEETGGIGWSSYQKLESSSSMSPRLEHADAKWKRALSDREDCPLASWGVSREQMANDVPASATGSNVIVSPNRSGDCVPSILRSV